MPHPIDHHHTDHQRAPGDGWAGEHEQLLADALAGVELDEDERRHLAWLATWDCPTVARTVRLLVRARGHDLERAGA